MGIFTLKKSCSREKNCGTLLRLKYSMSPASSKVGASIRDFNLNSQHKKGLQVCIVTSSRISLFIFSWWLILNLVHTRMHTCVQEPTLSQSRARKFSISFQLDPPNLVSLERISLFQILRCFSAVLIPFFIIITKFDLNLATNVRYFMLETLFWYQNETETV